MRFSLFIAILVLVSCQKKTEFSPIQVFGHGGNGVQISNSIYHDNTRESIELALSENGCEGVEVDVQLSKDGTAWLYHDELLENETDGKSCLNLLSDEEISKLKYTSIHGEKLIKLKDIELNSKAIFLDLKHANICESKVVDIFLMLSEIQLLKDKNPASNLYIVTNLEAWLNPLISAGFTVFYEGENFENCKSIQANNSISGILLKNEQISIDEVQSLKNLSLKVAIFEVRSPKGIRSALKKHPDFVISDDIKATLIEKN